MSCGFVTVLLLAVLMPTGCDAFAYNLVGTRSGCMTELDTSEIIMNNKVVAVSESDFPKMRLGLVHEKEPSSVIEVDYNRSLPFACWIRLSNPYDEFSTIEYVVETKSTSSKNSATFAEVGGCENNRRAAGKTGPNDLGIFFRIEEWPDSEGEFHVLGGWASGHEKVRLLEPLIFRRPHIQHEEEAHHEAAAPEHHDEHHVEEEQHHEQAEERHVEEKHHGEEGHQIKDEEVTEAEAAEQLEVIEELGDDAKKQEELAHDSKEKHHERLKALGERLAAFRDGNWHGLPEDLKRRWSPEEFRRLREERNIGQPKREYEERKELNEQHDPKSNLKQIVDRFRDRHFVNKFDLFANRQQYLHHKDEGKTASSQSFQDRYESENFGEGGPFDMHQFAYGAIFFIVSNLMVMQLCLMTGKREKGRRDM